MAAAALTCGACSSGDGSADSPTTPAASSDGLALNELQMIGTHNSYHVAPETRLFEAEKAAVEAFGEPAKALGDINALNYTHQSLTDQLESGIRSFELDIWADPEGGLFAKPLAPSMLNVPDTPIPSGLDAPGFKVLHIVDIDFGTTCPTFVGCLQEIRAWSDANADHVPIVINVELKDDPLPAPLDITKVVKIDATQMDALDAEIRSVFDDERLLTPDDVRGDAETLRDAVTTEGWPEIDDVRGQIMLFMDNAGGYRTDYLAGHPSLEGRVLFTSSAEDGDDDQAVVKINDPTEAPRITELVKQGFFIRTRADADLVEATTGDTTDRDLALESGAQVVSTDFPIGEPAANGYVVGFEKGPQVRCNRVIVERCPAGGVER
ncbi:MAG TPA: phosphatidylinositol-specific phospholipase C1-like protein [Microthrixaceae bacterium]|nr:phosphatidylinositol-specific phospholipase C1-like protein [Microthrixaceae bacterium]